MYRPVLVLIHSVLLVCTAQLYAFQNPIEDAKEVIKTTENDTLRAAKYYDLAYFTLGADVDQARLYSDSGFFFFSKIKDEAGIKLKLYLDAALSHAEGNYTEAINLNTEYLEWTRNAKNLVRESYAVSAMAKYYRELGKLEEAVDFTLLGLAIQDSLGQSDQSGFYYAELGDLYSIMKLWDEAEEYTHKSYELAVKTQYPIGQSFSLRNLGAIAIAKSEFDQAIQHLQAALKIDSSLNYSLGLSRNYQSLAEVENKKANYRSALNHLQTALSQIADSDNILDIARIHQEIGKNHLQLNEITEAKRHVLIAEQYRSQLNDQEWKVNQDLLLSDVYEQIGNYKKAFLASKSHRQANSEWLDENIANQITGLDIAYQTRQKEKEIQLLNTENELSSLRLSASNNRNIALALGLIILSLVSFFLFSLYRKINEQNQIISVALKEKDILLREIHHRVKNNLQVISSLLSLQGRYSDDPVIEKAIKESKDRVKSMSLIHQNLYQKENLTGIEIKSYFEQLFTSLFDSYNIKKGMISLKTEIEPMILDVDTVVPIGLVVNELVSNSLKYAFPNDSKGTIHVSLKEKDGSLKLDVSDDGIGISGDHIKSGGESFGFELIDAFAMKMDGQMEVISDKGTTVSMVINKYARVG